VPLRSMLVRLKIVAGEQYEQVTLTLKYATSSHCLLESVKSTSRFASELFHVRKV
jgi:hypothetical protein